MRRTKIVCTLGPASANEGVIEQMLKAGMNIARLNFSHGTHEGHREYIEMFRRVRDRLELPAGIMLDTKGPEIRLGNFENGRTFLSDGAEFTLSVCECVGNSDRAEISYKGLPAEVKAGDRMVMDDGRISLEVRSVTDTEIVCRVIHGGEISDRKSVNLPGVVLNMPYMNEKDKSDVLFGIEMDVDFIAASFVRSKDDVIVLRKFLDYNGGHDIKIISKIENMQGIENFDEILKVSDGIMIARGDMGVEVPFEKLPGLQKRFIRRCYKAGKMVITATQMLESMISNPAPTRAEITDVANAVFDGTSAVMLSGESAMGKYPVKAVETMAMIARQAEKDAFDMNMYNDRNFDMDYRDTANAICDAACTTARDINAKAIIAVTMHGHTARRMSKFRPIYPIVAATPKEKTYHQLALSWGVYPVMARMISDSDEIVIHAADCAKQLDLVQNGDQVVITAGLPLKSGASTNVVRIHTVGDFHIDNE
ncbi:MAG: pyruvate kinase [Clostridia bacterium]|nr:pyruvate kinase [Clostridia bacterium]